MRSSCNDKGELVMKGMRLCGFLPLNVPIISAMFLSAPTMFNTAFWQAVNQTYNAGLNYGNKNSSCNYTNMDLGSGFGAAITSSIVVGLSLRKMTAGMTATATGKKLLLLNVLVGASASGSANFCNTMCMRYTEIKSGITVYSDDELTNKAGVSKACAEVAVYNTAVSRVAMSIIALATPAALMLLMGGLGLTPKSKLPKLTLDVATVAFGLFIGLPLSVAMFPGLTIKKGKDCEEEFHKHDNIYFNRGM